MVAGAAVVVRECLHGVQVFACDITVIMGAVMLCKNPYVRDPTGKFLRLSVLTQDRNLFLQGVPFPCGQCLPCRINKRRVWTHRLILESMYHEESSFITLTYSDEYLPKGGTLRRKDLRDFFKRLRYYSGRQKLRYYACGEYGSQTHRPHYHAIIFGLGLLDGEKVAKSWPYGRVQCAECNEHTIQYVAGYVTKKFVRKDDGTGLAPEFAVMSRRPGIGCRAVEQLATLIRDPKYKHLFEGQDNLPSVLRHGKKKLPLGRFLRQKLADFLELDLDCRSYLCSLVHLQVELEKTDKYAQPLVEFFHEQSAQRVRQIEAKAKIYNTRRKI